MKSRIAMQETFETLLTRPGVRIERIVSHGQVTPAEAPFVQAHEEWVMVVAGAARLRIEAGGIESAAEVALGPGDHLLIPAGARHWVTWTATDEPTIWIAAYLGEVESG